METTLAILTVLGIYVGIPVVIGFGILGAVALPRRRAEVGGVEAGTEIEGTPATAERELVGTGRRSG